MDNYTKLISEDMRDVVLVLRDIIKKRQLDVEDFENLITRFASVSSHIPSSSSDVIASDTVGDTSYDPATGKLYKLGNNAGTPQWRFVQLNTF